MYSLYRAWLSMGPCVTTFSPSSSTTTPTAPDVHLQVGPNLINFSAHKAILAAHSGFFKAALATTNGTGPILVPNINVDEFSSLLTFMYTGYLDLNISNIYNILLATHILHMPRALEICRSFLLQSHPLEAANINIPPTTTNTVIKPIASRKEALPHPEIYQPLFNTSLQKSHETPFKEIVRESTTVVASTSKEVVKSNEETTTNSSSNKTINARSKRSHSKANKDVGIVANATAASSTSDSKVIIDIACCDGPVRFHRVVNKYYGLAGDDNDPTTNSPPKMLLNQSNDALNKVMNENIQLSATTTTTGATSDENHIANNASGEVFTCLYCNHTFKSQYCYQKHARRHLNPVSVDANANTKMDNNTTASSHSTKREVKLLDMNVQYYPCKTCGSKFPSYYFVHKHRKLCHADEMADKTNKNNEIVKIGTLSEESSKTGGTSIIDVEETND